MTEDQNVYTPVPHTGALYKGVTAVPHLPQKISTGCLNSVA